MTEYRNRSRPTSRKMTRVQFEMIAEVLKEHKPEVGKGKYAGRSEAYMSGAVAMWQESVYAMSSMCNRSNDRFRRDLFLKACGMED